MSSVLIRFLADVLILYSLKTPENNCFQEFKNGNIGQELVTQEFWSFLIFLEKMLTTGIYKQSQPEFTC